MRTLYIDCGMGAAGDMLTAALLELLPDKAAFLNRINDLGIPGVCYEIEESVKCGIKGTHVSVKVHGNEEGTCVHQEHCHVHGHHHEHEHSHDCEHHHESHEHDGHFHTHNGLHDIEHIVRGHLDLPKNVQDDIMAVYQMIAEAESHVHGVPVTEIHFHEVGNMDAIADITAVCSIV